MTNLLEGNNTSSQSDAAQGASDAGGSCNGSAKQSTGPLGNPAYNNTAASKGDPAFLTGRHTDGSEYLLCDGHVKYLKGGAVSPGKQQTSSGPETGTPSSEGNACTTDLLSANNFQATFSTL